MSIYSASVKRPILTSLVFVAIVIIGLFSYTRLSTELMPEMDTSNLMVITGYPGASAEDIESNVTKLLENSLNSVDNLKHIVSRSSENISLITLQFNAGTDISEATNDTRDKLDAIRASLPNGVTTPTIFKFGASDIPIAILSVRSQESSSGLKKILEDQVANPLARVPGVGSVSVSGALERVIQVYCDPTKLESYGLSVAQVSQIIAAENANIPAGQIDLGTKTNSIRIQGEFTSVEELEGMALASIGGRSIYLRDVARVLDTRAERQQENYTNGESGAIIAINKRSGGNAVAVAEGVRKAMPDIKKNLPQDVELEYLIDTTTFITNSLNSLTETIVVTFIIVFLVVYVFLGRSSATFIVVLTIPVSLIAAFAYLMASGNSLNIITLSALSIAIGMVVDDAIVVLENVTSHIERGSYPKQAAVHGTNEVGISVVASTLTMLAVFVPLTLIQGQSGLLFRQLGAIMTIVLIISTVAALSLTPMLSSQLLKRDSKQNKFAAALLKPFNKALDWIDVQYERLISVAVVHRRITTFVAFGVFGISLLLLPFMKMELMPSQDMGFINLITELPVGTSVEETRAISLDIDKRIRAEIPEVEVVSFSVGTGDASNAWSVLDDNGNNITTFHIGLVKRAERSKTQEQISDELLAMMAHYPQLSSYRIDRQSQGGGGGNTMTVDVYGHDFDATYTLSKQLKDKLEAEEAISSVNISRKDYTPELRFVFDRKKLVDNGLTLAGASTFLRNAINGAVGTYYREDGEEYDIRVSIDPQYRQSLQDVQNILLQTPSGNNIRLSELGQIEEVYTPPTIERKDRSRVISLTVSGVASATLSDVADQVIATLDATELPMGVTTHLGGTYETQQETNSELTILMLLVLILVFIVMAGQFESLRLPFVIMFSIPFAFTGVFLGMVVTQTPFGSMAFVGLIMLIGIVVKNGIVLIDYTLLLRERGRSIRRSVIAACRSRLRPVLMTTLTTVLGMVPMAIGIGEGSEMWQSMGVTIVFGLTLSTLVTLVLIPTLYTALEARFIMRERKAVSKKIARKHKQ